MRRIVLIGAILVAGAGLANLRAQTVLGDPRDAARTFASNCSACHKSPQGLAKSGQVAGFLRQHYTTGAEMSAAMAAYLVSAGSGPAARKGQTAATAAAGAESPAAAAKAKRKQEQLTAVQPSPEAAQAQANARTLRGKQRQQMKEEQAARTAPAERPVVQPTEPAARPEPAPHSEEQKQAAAPVATAPAVSPPAMAPQQAPAAMMLDIPLPPMPDSPPAELTQSAFSSSPLP